MGLTADSNKSKPSTKTLREFGWVVGGILILLFGVIRPLIHVWGQFDCACIVSISSTIASHSPQWPWFIGGGLAIVGTIVPQLLSPVYWLWMKIGDVLGWVNTRIILSVFFFIAITPVGFIMRLLNYDPMRRKWDAKASTYRVEIPSLPDNHLEVLY